MSTAACTCTAEIKGLTAAEKQKLLAFMHFVDSEVAALAPSIRYLRESDWDISTRWSCTCSTLTRYGTHCHSLCRCSDFVYPRTVLCLRCE